MNAYEPIRLLKRYVGKMRTLRNELRSERLLNSLPSNIHFRCGGIRVAVVHHYQDWLSAKS